MDSSAPDGPRIIEFQKEDARKLAELFNSFDKPGLWPGGFTGGVPFTAERVLDSFPVAQNSICILISTVNGSFTGICSLHPHYEDSDAAYIGVFGVHPEYLGKGHGKALILRAIQTAKEENIKRVDLDTWAGNLRAVPLYKKCGMFWVPETSVRMQGYIPGILNFPLAKEFFRKHDWYKIQIRELKPVPDEFKIGEMELFPYEFSKDRDHLKIYVDRYGRSLSGIERTLNDETISIQVRLKQHKVIAGAEQEFAIDINNATESQLQGSLFLAGFEGLTFTSRPQQSFSIQPDESLALRGNFTVSPEIEVPDISRKQKTIKANLVINGELIPLEIGMRILPLLEYKTYPEALMVQPGTKGKIQFNVFNNSKDSFKGKAFLVDELGKLSLGENTFPIEIPPKSHSGFHVQIEIPDDAPTCVIPLKLFAKGRIKNSEIETKMELTHIKCTRPGGIVHYVKEVKRGKSVFIESEDILLRVQLRGGSLEITYKKAISGSVKILSYGGFGIGPPYGFVRPIDYDYEVIREPESLRLTLAGVHPDKSGIKMERTLTCFFGTTLIKDQIRVINSNPEVAHKINARIFGRLSRGPLYKLVVPLQEILEQELVEFPASRSDLPDDPKKYSESWACFEDQVNGFCFGQLWSNKRLFKIRFDGNGVFLPEYELGAIKPGKSGCTSEFYYLVEGGTWHAVRERWKSLIAKKFSPKDPKVVKAKPLFDAKLADTTFFDSSQVKKKLELVNFRNKPAAGMLHFVPPNNWKIQPLEIRVEDVTLDNSFSTNVNITPPSDAELGIHSGTMNFSADNFETSFPLDFCILSKSTKSAVQVVEEKEANMTIFKILNGFTLFKASADFAGCLYFFGNTTSTNQLDTSFPKIQTKVFLENYSGGIRLLYLGEGFGFEKSKTHRESFRGQPVEEGLWKGVCFSFETKEDEEIKGLLGSISFLTLPYSNIVKIKRRFENPTQAIFKFNSCLWISPRAGGDFQGNKAVFPRGDKIFQFKRAERSVAVSGVTPEKGWIYVVNEEKKQGLGIVAGNTDKSSILSLDIGKTMLELFVMSKTQLLPKEICEFKDFMLLGDEKFEFMDRMAQTLREMPE
ncbi:GNAT family N-acetyltransferase [Candidatus Bathyarchaeota archaeon]|nr:GNAT family N-acetyltransferase [Candidatus Bathyarchaeota archaeon]NIV44595.1 GNAT family N-acetyltransferase [Candidatus Bathyarchaeota archaeon]